MDPDSNSIFTALGAFLVLTLLSAAFAAAQAAFTALNDNQIRRQAAEGNRRAKSIVKLLKSPRQFMATVTTGQTLCEMFALTSIAPAATAALVSGSYPAGTYVPPTTYFLFLGVVTLCSALVILALGNMIPSRIGSHFSERTAVALTPFLRFFYLVLRPIVWLIMLLSNLGLTLMGQNPHEEPETVTEEEIRMMVTVGEEKGTIEQSEKDMINNIFEFDDKVVTEVMTHRMEMVALKNTCTLSEAVEVAQRSGHSRIPVYKDSIDNIIGVLYVKELLRFVMDDNSCFDLSALLHEPFYIPETAKCTELFKEFQAKQFHMAIVIDEYGGTYGIVTMEDLLETIVGNIQDEFDNEANEYIQLSDTEYCLDGWISVDEVEDLLHIEIPDDSEYDTLGGVIVDMLDDIPDEGEHPSVQIGNVLFTVLEVDDRRISRLKATLLPADSDAEQEAE